MAVRAVGLLNRQMQAAKFITSPKKGAKLDVPTTRMVAGFLGATCLLCVGGILYLSAIGKEPHLAIVITLSSAIGSLVGILVPNRSESSRPQEPPNSKIVARDP